MKKKLRSSEPRRLAAMYRNTKAMILEIHREGLRYRAAMRDYERWEKTPEYQEHVARLKETARKIKEETGIDIWEGGLDGPEEPESAEPENEEKGP